VSLDKAIAHGKEHRKPYHGSKAFDASCRSHGDCPWCQKKRKHKTEIAKARAPLDDESEAIKDE
jgi:hypothetical protein